MSFYELMMGVRWERGGLDDNSRDLDRIALYPFQCFNFNLSVSILHQDHTDSMRHVPYHNRLTL